MLSKEKDCFLYDNSYWRIRDDVIVSPSNDISVYQYLFGRCHLFAKVMARKLNKDYGWMINDEPCQDDSTEGFEALPILNHAFVYPNKPDNIESNPLLIDARGLVSRDSVIDDYTTEMIDLDNNMEIVNPDELHREWINNGLLLNFLPNEEKEIENFIDEMVHLNLLKPITTEQTQTIKKKLASTHP